MVIRVIRVIMPQMAVAYFFASQDTGSDARQLVSASVNELVRECEGTDRDLSDVTLVSDDTNCFT